MLKIALSANGKFHTFDLARELYARGALAGIYSGYPRFKLRNEALPQELIHTFPLIHGAYMAARWRDKLPLPLLWAWERFDAASFGAYVARHLPPCDVYMGLSGSSLAAGKRAHQIGARYICDRGSSHIRVQDKIDRDECALWGFPVKGVDPRVIETEEAEYAAADRITVPSKFSYGSFLSQGVPAEKLRLLPYGVNLSRFEPVGRPAEGRFDVLFVGAISLRKGVQYLAQAFNKLEHPAKSLTFVGATSEKITELLQRRNLLSEHTRQLGHMPQTELKTLMSRSHVMVLPSVEDGFGVVLAQAMACGCPVIGAENTGAPDIVDDGVEGYIVPIRDVDALTARLQHMADHPDERAAMGEKALARVQGLGGWRSYGEKAMAIFNELAATK